jgi:hypothetical protein
MNQNNYKKNLSIFFVCLLVLVAGVYFYSKQGKVSQPHTIIPPQDTNSPTISLYNDVPPPFPREIILEDRPLDYAGSVALPDGSTQIKVSYKSTLPLIDLASLYGSTLPKKGWNVLSNTISNIVTIITEKKSNKIIITMVQLQANEVLVTFQLDK